MSTRASSKSSEKVQAAILRKEEENGRPFNSNLRWRGLAPLRRRLGYAKIM
jgi:hypothetical protein